MCLDTISPFSSICSAWSDDGLLWSRPTISHLARMTSCACYRLLQITTNLRPRLIQPPFNFDPSNHRHGPSPLRPCASSLFFTHLRAFLSGGLDTLGARACGTLLKLSAEHSTVVCPLSSPFLLYPKTNRNIQARTAAQILHTTCATAPVFCPQETIAKPLGGWCLGLARRAVTRCSRSRLSFVAPGERQSETLSQSTEQPRP